MANRNPKVSVILSYYKGDRYLDGFLKNFEEQTLFLDTQLVFVGCLLSDGEKQTVVAFKEKHPAQVKVVSLDTLETQSACWNLGIKNADADLVCIWNVDDQRTPYSIETQYKKLLSEPPTTVATFGYFIITNQFLKREGKLIDHSSYSPQEYERSMLLGPFFMFRKSTVGQIGYFDEQLKSGADYDFAIRLAKAGNIRMIKSVDGYFLDEGKGLSTGGNKLQPIERTVVELRYDLHDKVDQRFVAAAQKYEIQRRLEFGNWKDL